MGALASSAPKPAPEHLDTQKGADRLESREKRRDVRADSMFRLRWLLEDPTLDNEDPSRKTKISGSKDSHGANSHMLLAEAMFFMFGV